MSERVLCEKCAKAIEDRTELCVQGVPLLETASLHKQCYIEMKNLDDPAHKRVNYIDGETGIAFFARILKDSRLDIYTILVISAFGAAIASMLFVDSGNRYDEAVSKVILLAVILALVYVPPLRKTILHPILNFVHRHLFDLIYMKYWSKIPRREHE